MFQVRIIEPDKKERIATIEDTSALIGKGRECKVRLSGWRVGREHVRLFHTK
jgi:pilus assembly protein CpaF